MSHSSRQKPRGRQIGIDDRVRMREPEGHVGAPDHLSIDRDITVQQVRRVYHLINIGDKHSRVSWRLPQHATARRA
jgi:hypothetical protein